jgi:glycosyltransferase involved in cell wall biosynthesis
MSTTNLPQNVIKYLAKYKTGSWIAAVREDKKFNNIAVIPALNEAHNIKRLINSLCSCDNRYTEDTLFLFVVNNTSETPEEAKEDNYRTIEYLKENLNGKLSINLGYIDASTTGNELPEKEGGVGLARKIGMDEALTLFNYNNSRSKILICLDADCTVEPNYLTEIVDAFNKYKHDAAYVNFEHPMPEDLESKLAIICYEIFLRYYVLGLMYAKSDYAIHTIGSTMICTCESYIKVEGMNKKKAAEDFYFMEKLCKNYEINKIDTTKIYPSSRGSWRVPFGTGQRVNRYLAKTHDEHILYSPESFDILKRWLEVFNSSGSLSSNEYLTAAAGIHPSLYRFLVDNKFEESWEKIKTNCRDDKQAARQKHFWFDGFRTLKLIHYLRDNGFPPVDMYEAVRIMASKFDAVPDLYSGDDIYSDPDKQMPYLELLRRLA